MSNVGQRQRTFAKVATMLTAAVPVAPCAAVIDAKVVQRIITTAIVAARLFALSAYLV